MQENVQPVLSRPAMEYLCAEIGKLKDEPLRALCQYAIAKIAPRIASFDVADETVKVHLSDILIINNWIDYAETIGDNSYKKLLKKKIQSNRINNLLKNQLKFRQEEIFN